MEGSRVLRNKTVKNDKNIVFGDSTEEDARSDMSESHNNDDHYVAMTLEQFNDNFCDRVKQQPEMSKKVSGNS